MAKPTGKPPGRPTKLTPELAAGICKAIEEWNYLETAAELHDVTRQSVYNWLERGARSVGVKSVPKSEALFVEFFYAVTRARARAESEALKILKRGDAKGTGFGRAKAAAFYLERARAEKFAPRVVEKVETAVGEVLEVVRDVCAQENCERIYELLLTRLSRLGGDDQAPAVPSSTGLH